MVRCILHQTQTFHLSQYLDCKEQDGNQFAFICTFAVQQSQYNHTRVGGSRILTKTDTYSDIYCASTACPLLTKEGHLFLTLMNTQ